MRDVEPQNPGRMTLGAIVDSWSLQPNADKPDELLELILQAYWRGALGERAILFDINLYAQHLEEAPKLDSVEPIELTIEVIIERLSGLGSPLAQVLLTDMQVPHLETASLDDYGDKAKDILLRDSLIADPEAITQWSVMASGAGKKPGSPFLGIDPDGNVEALKERFRKSPKAIERWYIETWMPERESQNQVPSREDDLEAVRAKFGRGATSARMMRELRRDHAPAHWKKGGRPLKART